MDQELADAAAYAPDRCFVCTHHMAALFCVKCMTSRPPSGKCDVK